jgi:hypothetical protein
MNEQARREEMLDMIIAMEKLAEKLSAVSQRFPAIERNAKRIKASIAMMKLNLGE